MPRIYPRAFEGEAPREFGIDANAVKTRTIDLTVARITPQRIEMGGSILWAVAATSLAALVDIRFNDTMRDPIPFQSGMFLRGLRFSRIFVSNAAQAGQTITLLYAVEGPGNIQVENPAASYAQVDLTKSNAAGSGADMALVAAAAAAQVLAANGNRRLAFIGSLLANTAEIRIGDGNTGAARGIQLNPGDAVCIATTQVILGYTPGPGNQTVTRVWTED